MTENKIILKNKATLKAERYIIRITEEVRELITSDDLGFVYGLLFISERYLSIKPFWFWMDQKFEKITQVSVIEEEIISPQYIVKYRGWFFNDEVLMMKWDYNKNNIDGWKMAFEALLRCGGNMTIPGTDKMSFANRQLASDMGLWITHHHAEPLGAEMFVRAYPDLEANYLQHADKFHKIWEEAVIAQKDYKVVWNLCFRGQGDTPFWNADTTGSFNTPQQRGRLISDVIKKQWELVIKYIDNTIFCTNLDGEIIEIYEDGLIDLIDGIIKL